MQVSGGRVKIVNCVSFGATLLAIAMTDTAIAKRKDIIHTIVCYCQSQNYFETLRLHHAEMFRSTEVYTFIVRNIYEVPTSITQVDHSDPYKQCVQSHCIYGSK